jgi:thiamine biosynthesis lipoprotein
MERTSFDAIGTHWDIAIEDKITTANAQGLFCLLRERIELFEATYSRFRDESLIDKIAQSPGDYTIPPDGKRMFDAYQFLYRQTEGQMTPLIGNTLVEAGYDKNYSLTKKILHTPPAWDDVLSYHFPTLTVKHKTQLDLGALGKGYCIDIVGEMLEEKGIGDYMINAGGDIRYRTTRNTPLVVGLEHPRDKTSVIGTVEIFDGSICGSAGSRRAWSDMHHIINPTTLTSPRDITSVWAIAKTTLIADAMTTALFFTDPNILTQTFSFSYLIMNADSSTVRSPDFPATLFTE